MKKEEILSVIKNYIKKAQTNNGFGKSDSITRDFIVDNINIEPTAIHVALIDLHEKGEIEYNANSGIILLLN